LSNLSLEKNSSGSILERKGRMKDHKKKRAKKRNRSAGAYPDAIEGRRASEGVVWRSSEKRHQTSTKSLWACRASSIDALHQSRFETGVRVRARSWGYTVQRKDDLCTLLGCVINIGWNHQDELRDGEMRASYRRNGNSHFSQKRGGETGSGRRRWWLVLLRHKAVG